MKVPNAGEKLHFTAVSLSRLQNEGSQLPAWGKKTPNKSIKATE